MPILNSDCTQSTSLTWLRFFKFLVSFLTELLLFMCLVVHMKCYLVLIFFLFVHGKFYLRFLQKNESFHEVIFPLIFQGVVGDVGLRGLEGVQGKPVSAYYSRGIVNSMLMYTFCG